MANAKKNVAAKASAVSNANGRKENAMNNIDIMELRNNLNAIDQILRRLEANEAPAKVEAKAPAKKATAKKAPVKASRAELLKEFKTVNAAWYDAIKGDKGRVAEFNAAADLWVKAKLDEAPAKEIVAEEKPRFTEKQLAAQKAWGERQKERAANFKSIKSPEYQELWATWKADHAAEYGEATKRADKQVLNKAGHKWVMGELDKAAKESAAPATKKPAKKAPVKAKKATAKKTTKK